MDKNWLVIKQFSKRNKLLKDNGFTSYKQFLNSPQWKQIHKLWEGKKKKGIQRWKECFCCGATERLQLHHLKYKNVMKAYLGNNIVPVCNTCHETIHDMTARNSQMSIKLATKKLAKKFTKLYTTNIFKIGL